MVSRMMPEAIHFILWYCFYKLLDCSIFSYINKKRDEFLHLFSVERKTGLKPATLSLEG